MSQLINYFTADGDNCNTKAILPVVGQAKVSIPVGAGSTATDLFPTVPSGASPYSAGQIKNDSCADLQVKLTYLAGSDCDSCTVDTLSSSSITVVVPKGSVFPLPAGLISAATVITGTWNSDNTFTPSDVTKTAVVEWYSHYQPCCGSKILVP